MARRLPWGWIALIAVAAAAGGAAYWYFEPMADWTGLVEQWVEETGALGVVLFVGIYALALLLLLPGAVLNVAAGALFGLGWGFGAVMAASMLAAFVAFMIARYLLRDRIVKHYTKKGTPAAIDRALRSEGWRAVALLRLSPVMPFAVKSYLFGVSRVHLRDYLLGTFLGKIPGALVFTALGTTGRAAMDLSGSARWSLIATGIGATALVSWLVARATRRRLNLA